MNKRFSDNRKIGSARRDNPQGYSSYRKYENGPSQLAYSEWQKAGLEQSAKTRYTSRVLG